MKIIERPWPKEGGSQHLEQWQRKTVEAICRNTNEIHCAPKLSFDSGTNVHYKLNKNLCTT